MRRLAVLLCVLGLAGAASGAADRRERIAFARDGDLFLVAPDGTGLARLTRGAALDSSPALSPGGGRVAFVREVGGDEEVYVVGSDGTGIRRLTRNPGRDDRDPAWSPDGRRLAWASGSDGDFDLFAMRPDGSGKRLLAGGAGDNVEPAWGPGGELAFSSSRAGTFDLWIVEAAGAAPRQLTAGEGSEREPAWSAAGRIAFVSDRDGGEDLYATWPDGTTPTRITDDPAPARSPAWSPDGRRLAFARGGDLVVAAADGSSVRALVAGEQPSWGSLPPPSPPPAPPKPKPKPGPRPEPKPKPPPAPPAELLPELDQRAPRDLSIQRQGSRFLLGFTSATDNVGAGPLWIRGERPLSRGDMTANQLIARADGSVRIVRDVGRIRYTWSSSHSHFHLLRFQRFELRRAGDLAVVARDRKTGFCLADHYGLARARVRNFRPPRFLGDCARGHPDQLRVEQGSSPGYTDRYPAYFHGQNVDVTGLPPGVYVLVHRANADGRLHERTLANNAASVRLRLTWPNGRRAAPRVAVLRVCEGSERCGARSR